jgi:hypothetical protein
MSIRLDLDFEGEKGVGICKEKQNSTIVTEWWHGFPKFSQHELAFSFIYVPIYTSIVIGA